MGELVAPLPCPSPGRPRRKAPQTGVHPAGHLWVALCPGSSCLWLSRVQDWGAADSSLNPWAELPGGAVSRVLGSVTIRGSHGVGRAGLEAEPSTSGRLCPAARLPGRPMTALFIVSIRKRPWPWQWGGPPAPRHLGPRAEKSPGWGSFGQRGLLPGPLPPPGHPLGLRGDHSSPRPEAVGPPGYLMGRGPRAAPPHLLRLPHLTPKVSCARSVREAVGWLSVAVPCLEGTGQEGDGAPCSCDRCQR